MRSDLVIHAATAVSNRFLLVHVTAALTRKFHRKTKDRLPETINNSLAGLAEGKYNVCADDVHPRWLIIEMPTVPLEEYGKPKFLDDEPTPQERMMAVSSALLNVTDELAEIA